MVHNFGHAGAMVHNFGHAGAIDHNFGLAGVMLRMVASYCGVLRAWSRQKISKYQTNSVLLLAISKTYKGSTPVDGAMHNRVAHPPTELTW
jgi:hypothetical protein